jgi:hypothetical protein
MKTRNTDLTTITRRSSICDSIQHFQGSITVPFYPGFHFCQCYYGERQATVQRLSYRE